MFEKSNTLGKVLTRTDLRNKDLHKVMGGKNTCHSACAQCCRDYQGNSWCSDPGNHCRMNIQCEGNPDGSDPCSDCKDANDCNP